MATHEPQNKTGAVSALAAAFSFVIMMFNVPIPGGVQDTQSQRVGRNHIGAVGGSRKRHPWPFSTVLAFW